MPAQLDLPPKFSNPPAVWLTPAATEQLSGLENVIPIAPPRLLCLPTEEAEALQLLAFAKCVGIINIIIVTRMVPKRTWVLFIALKCKQSIKGYIFLVRGPLAFIDFAHRDLRSSGDIVTPVHLLEADRKSTRLNS